MMRNNSSSKTGLFLMELIVAVLFFSLASAISIQLFVKSHIISSKSVNLNHSVLWAQNIAETFYGCNGNIDQMTGLLDNCIPNVPDAEHNGLTILFDKDFNPIDPDSIIKERDIPDYTYRLSADITKKADLMICNITINSAQEAEPIYSLNISLFPDKEITDEQ